jgi:hypothetical protein
MLFSDEPNYAQITPDSIRHCDSGGFSHSRARGLARFN